MQINDIVTRFMLRHWRCQQVAQGYYKINPPGLHGYKQYLLTFNPWKQTWQLVGTKQTNDPHYREALKILSDRPLKSDRRQLTDSTVSSIQDTSMFPIKVSPVKWINLAAIGEVEILADDNICVTWVWGDSEYFHQEVAQIILSRLKDLEKIALPAGK